MIELKLPKIIEFDLSGKQIGEPFPLIPPLRELLNEHVVWLNTNYAFEELLHYDLLGAKMWDRTVKEILSMQTPGWHEKYLIEDYLRDEMPSPGESDVELSSEFTFMILNILKEKQITFFSGTDPERLYFLDFSIGEINGPVTIDEYGRLGITMGSLDGFLGEGRLPFLPESYSKRVVYVFGAMDDCELLLTPTPFLVKDISEGCGDKTYTSRPIDRILTDDGLVSLNFLIYYIGILEDPDGGFKIYDKDGNKWDFDVRSSNYEFMSPVPPDCSLMQTEEQARKQYPDYFPKVNLEATKRNSIRVF